LRGPFFKAFLKALLDSSARRSETTIEELQAKAKIPREEAALASSYLEERGIIDTVEHGTIDLEDVDRISLSLLAIEEGIDVEAATRNLSWRDFERFAGESLKAENFKVLSNLYFINRGDRRQIDLLGIKEPLILSIDCKHWRFRFSSSRILAAVEAHIERTQALADHVTRKGEIKGLSLTHRKCYMLPVMVLLAEPYDHRIVSGVPVVPLLKFRDFLRNIPPIPGFEPMRYIPINLSNP
jgi:hypothetical protein